MSWEVFSKRKKLLEDNGYATYQDYLKSDTWKRIRTYVYRRDGYKCRLCGEQGRLTAHHLTYDQSILFADPTTKLGKKKLRDLVSLCDSCHTAVHKDDDGEFIHLGSNLRELLLPVPHVGPKAGSAKNRSRKMKSRQKHLSIPLSAAKDNRLSFTGRGLLLYLASKPEGYVLDTSELATESGTARTAVDKAVRELRNLGYLENRKSRKSGKVNECKMNLAP